MDGGGGNRAEAERWLYTANKLLSARDLHGAQSFAIRARESDPTFDASELLLTVIDTLLAGETRINDQHRDWYGILQILRYSTNIDHIAAQYHRLALLLDPHRNPFAFAAHAFSLIHDAWSVLSNPAKKAMYDADLRLLTSTPPPAPAATQHHHHQHHQHNPLTQAQPQSTDAAATESSFWTSCPYCYVLYEYPRVYEECTLRCQSCRRGFQAVVIRSPPLNGKDSSFCSWGFFPLGFSQDSKDINGFSSNWNPFSPLFPCPLKGSNRRKASWTYYDDEAAAAFVERRGGGNLDLNVEFSNDPEEPSRRVGVREGNAAGNAEDNMEGIGFFEGLDEFLSSLPILNVVADDKAKGN
ncbi:hypothetical protein Ahy_B03g063346 isoform C [Arachis hypogaea]|uniref:J domain-containing protein n=1 Tax=Arachis hypogaea TaxID=3818 RepID=A0A444ZWZ9_ARAHY|nr:hypothetical protein Ahy_B03g063346 isoform C [Arachis hypogaea]